MNAILKAVKYGFVVLFVGGVIVAALGLVPTETRSVSDIEGYDELDWRPVATTPRNDPDKRDPAATDLLVVDGGTVYRIPRTQAVAKLLWLATQTEGVTIQ